MSLKKQYLKSRPICKVTFRISKDAAKSATAIALAGDFNAWDVTTHPMTALKNGEFTAIVELPTSMPEYQFRYLYQQEAQQRWENDWQADAYVTNGFGEENSVVRV